MKKTKKTLLYIIIAVLILIITAGAIILFGVVGIDQKAAYSESEKASNNINTGITIVDESTTYQTLKGFGASAGQWGQEVGKWDNSREILSYLYDSDKGIGLNIYRYNLGTGSDAEAQKCLMDAKELAGDDLRVTLFCDNEFFINNSDLKDYESLADFCYSSAVHFLDEGYRVTDVSPISELQDNGQAYYSKNEARDLLKVFVDKFDGSDVDKKGCRVSIPIFMSDEYLDCILGKEPEYVFKNIKLRKYFDNVNVSTYQSKESAEKSGTNGMTIEYGVAMSKVIIDALTVTNATEWDWWTACSYGTYTDGLIYLNPDNHNDIKTSKRLWCLGNFSKFIDEGAIRLACSSGVEGLDSCAFANLDGTNVIVYVNNTDKDLSTTYDCQSNYEVYTTSADHDLEMTDSGNKGNTEISIPAMSVVTVVVG